MDMDRALDREIDKQTQEALPEATDASTPSNQDTTLVTPLRKQKAYSVVDQILAVEVAPAEITAKLQATVASAVLDRSDPKKTHVDVDIKHSFTKIDLSLVGGKPAPVLEPGEAEPIEYEEAELVEPAQVEGGGGGGAT